MIYGWGLEKRNIPRLDEGDEIFVMLVEIDGTQLPPQIAVVDRLDVDGNSYRDFPDHQFRARYVRPGLLGNEEFRWLGYDEYGYTWQLPTILDRMANAAAE